MSYNCTRWKTKDLNNLRMPVASLYEHDRSDWHPLHTVLQDGRDEFLMIESSIRGKVVGDTLAVDEIEMSGEGSGTSLNWIVEPALRKSTGRLVASRIWEGGDSIDLLTVIDGELTTEPIDV